MEKINNKRLMVTYSIMKFIMPCFNVNKNRSHNKIKLYPGGGGSDAWMGKIIGEKRKEL
jgi:hypothetical protein